MNDHFIISDGKIVMAPKTTRQRILGALATFGLVSALVIGALSLASPAKADPKLDRLATGEGGRLVCEILAGSGVNTQTIMKIGDIVHNRGYSYRDAGGFVMLSAMNQCPEYVPALNKWAKDHGSDADNTGPNKKTV